MLPGRLHLRRHDGKRHFISHDVDCFPETGFHREPKRTSWMDPLRRCFHTGCQCPCCSRPDMMRSIVTAEKPACRSRHLSGETEEEARGISSTNEWQGRRLVHRTCLFPNRKRDTHNFQFYLAHHIPGEECATNFLAPTDSVLNLALSRMVCCCCY